MLCWFCIVQNFWQATKASLLWGIAPVQVVSHLCHCIVQCFVWLTASILAWSRGGSPSNIAPARMPGVYAKRLCTMQSQPSIHSPSPRGRGLGLGIENKHFFGKTDFFYSLRAAVHKTVARKAVILFCFLHRSYIITVYCRTVYGKICSYTEGI